jgi:hypothetical protein
VRRHANSTFLGMLRMFTSNSDPKFFGSKSLVRFMKSNYSSKAMTRIPSGRVT